MAKNRTMDIMDRLQQLEDAQVALAQQKVYEAAAQGETITLEEATTPTIVNRIYREVPTGVCNGVNMIFTLNKKPLFKTEEIYLSGCMLRKGLTNDYMIDYENKIIIMNYPPESDDVLEVSYDFQLNGI